MLKIYLFMVDSLKTAEYNVYYFHCKLSERIYDIRQIIVVSA